MNEGLLSVAVTQNPEADIAVGTALRYSSILFRTLPETPHGSIANWGLFNGAVLAVASPIDGRTNLCGSAVLVAPGIAIGAMHVFDDSEESVMAARAGAMCFGLSGDRAHVWRIKHIISSQKRDSDLTIFSMELASALPADNTFTQAIVSTRTPAIGERLTIFGFRESADEPGRSLAAPQVRVTAELLVSTGVVTQQFPFGRDSVGLPCPCLEVQCHTVGGMSGGPAFDEAGRLIGVLSRGLDEGPSWVSLLWPALGWTLRGGWPTGILKEGAHLVETDARICAIDGRDALKFSQDGRQLLYAPWS